eukprot:6258042-Amphidinium_carterae.1
MTEGITVAILMTWVPQVPVELQAHVSGFHLVGPQAHVSHVGVPPGEVSGSHVEPSPQEDNPWNPEFQ